MAVTDSADGGSEVGDDGGDVGDGAGKVGGWCGQGRGRSGRRWGMSQARSGDVAGDLGDYGGDVGGLRGRCRGTASSPPLLGANPHSPDKDIPPIRPMIPSQDPGFDSTFCQVSTCGNITWQGNFKLPMPAASSGWIVQEISYDLNVAGGVHLQGHYWEGFFVEQGATRGVYQPGPDDTYKSTGETAHPANSKGMSTVIGKAKFYEGTLPADFICPNEAAKAGTLRATTTQPPFWDGTGTDHNLTITWDCTGSNDIRTVLAEPDPDGFCPKN